MSRKLVLKALSVAVPVALLVGVGWEAVSSGSVRPSVPPVTFTGAVSCNLSGSATIAPTAFQTSSSASYTITFTGKNNKCVGLPYVNSAGSWSTTSLTQRGSTSTSRPETLKSSTESWTIVVGNTGSLIDLCTALESGGSLPIASFTGSITWLGTSPIAPTTISFAAGSVVSITPPVISLANGITGGSFAGSVDASLRYSVLAVFHSCLSTGLSAATLASFPDNLLVGQGF